MLLLILLLLMATSCTRQGGEEKVIASMAKDFHIPDSLLQGFILLDKSIYVENIDSTNTDKDRYDHDNLIYTHHAVFRYTYTHHSPDGEALYFWGIGHDWELVPASIQHSNAIREVVFEITPNTYYTDYDQTRVLYKYPPETSFSQSGVIENKLNIWLHPPRDGLFRILELNPFPYIKQPFTKGNNWTWTLGIGSHWGDARWREWDGRITNTYAYEIVDERILETTLGSLYCYKIAATASSELGSTALLAYFNEKHGFVKLDYTNIDGSKTVLELVDRK
jgi:hypothetical protein